jgi:hypothetical protein
MNNQLSNYFYNVNGSILKLENVYQLDDKFYTLMNVFYKDKNVGSLIYSFEYNDINFLSNRISQDEYELISITLDHYHYLDNKKYLLPKLDVINKKTYLEYKYTDINNNINIKIEKLRNTNNEDEYVSYQIYENSNLIAIITTDREYNNRLTFVRTFENNKEKLFYFNLIKLVLYEYNNNNLVHCDAKARTITFNQFEDKNYHYI